jgi:hypothetical protein
VNLEALELALEQLRQAGSTITRLASEANAELQPVEVRFPIYSALSCIAEAEAELRKAAAADPDPQRAVVG